jgi:hypothetical protein
MVDVGAHHGIHALVTAYELRVRVERLDALLARHAPANSTPFVKIDTQGFEPAVIRSAGTALRSVIGLQLELSLVSLYEGDALLPEMVRLLAAEGFALVSLEPGHADYTTGQLLQADGIFFRQTSA